jgi:diacylglycerol kinase
MNKIRRLIRSFYYAFRGLFKTFREEQNLKAQTVFGIIVIIVAPILKVSPLEWCALVIVIGMVIITEIINSAIERVTDVLKPRLSDYVKEIKDIMAAAVMLSSITAIVVGLIIFWPYLYNFVSSNNLFN